MNSSTQYSCRVSTNKSWTKLKKKQSYCPSLSLPACGNTLTRLLVKNRYIVEEKSEAQHLTLLIQAKFQALNFSSVSGPRISDCSVIRNKSVVWGILAASLSSTVHSSKCCTNMDFVLMFSAVFICRREGEMWQPTMLNAMVN